MGGRYDTPRGKEDQKEDQMPAYQMLTAYEITSLCRRLWGFSHAELKQIPILPAGCCLEQGAIYLDLTEHPARAFTASVEMEARADRFYVPKSQIPDRLWNRLLGRRQPDQLWMRLTGGDQPGWSSLSNRQNPENEGKQRAIRWSGSV